MKQVMVVGAGVAGLAAAVRLQHAGYQVTLIEKESSVGGKMNQIRERGFSFDVGPTIVMMPEIYREVFLDCGRNPDDYIPMRRVEPMLTLNFPNANPLLISGDLVELTRTMEAVSERDAEGYFAYLASIYKRYRIAKEHFITRSFRGPLDFYNPKSLYHGLRLRTLDDAYTSISRFVKDDRLKKALASQTLYIGISPFDGPSLYTIIPMIELIYGVWFIKGGMYQMAEAMKKLFLELGGKLMLGTQVDEIVIRKGRAKGVRVGDKTYAADSVVCDADFPYAVKNLIRKPSDRGPYSDQKLSRMTYSCSCFVLYLGLDKKYPVQSLHTIRFSGNFEKNVQDIFQRGQLPDDPSFYLYVPSFLDDTLAPEGSEALYVLVPVPDLTGSNVHWREETVQAYRDRVLELVERETVFSDVRDHIWVEKCYTPQDFESRFFAMHGATFGLRPTLRQSNYFRPHNKFSGAEGLYFCGSSTHPGAGVPIVLTSAKLAAEELMRDDRA
jgi:phytoene desaturase